ncbi:MAG: LTA synthase family protein [Bacteroidales bacterium]|nr:LTA synthase family protein [Candidatus Colimorpha onthohippi]
MKRLGYLLQVYAIGIVIFTLFRIGCSVVYCMGAGLPFELSGLYLKALLMGWRFDTVISCYVLSLPIILLIIGEFCSIKSKIYHGVIHYYVLVCYIVCFFACAADIPYFSYNFARLSASTLNYADSFAMVVSMIANEPSYVAYFFVFLVVAAGYCVLMRWVYRHTLMSAGDRVGWRWSIPTALVLILFCILGMRGRLEAKSPIRTGTAYFCNDPYINQIGLNPVFTFVKSYQDNNKDRNKRIDLIDAELAEQVYRTELCEAYQPDAEICLPDGMNVVVVLMESMTVAKTGLFDAEHSLTPHLDSLMQQGLLFDHTFSAGIHTYNGIYSALYSQPALLGLYLMKRTVLPKLEGLPHAMKASGRHTFFAMTHDQEFDNMGGFLKANAFETVLSQEHYPQSEVVGTWGVPDHCMLMHAIEQMNSYNDGKPFFACLLTCSDHGPYIVPEVDGFSPKHQKIDSAVVEYADWSINAFLQQARKCSWFDNTLFVFLADHGASRKSDYDMSLMYNHIPMLFYCPKYIKPECRNDLALQIDMGPTVMAMMRLNTQKPTLGIDLLHQRRPYAYFSADDKIGVLSHNYFYVYHADSKIERLYHYSDNDITDYMQAYPDTAAAMQRYAFSMVQVSQRMVFE